MTKLNMSSLKKQKTDDLAREGMPPVEDISLPVIAQTAAFSSKTESPTKAKISLASFRKEPERKAVLEESTEVVPPVVEVIATEVIPSTETTKAKSAEVINPSSSVLATSEKNIEKITLNKGVTVAKAAVVATSKIELKIPESKSKEFFPNFNIADTENFFKDFDEAGLESIKKDEVEAEEEKPEAIPTIEVAEVIAESEETTLPMVRADYKAVEIMSEISEAEVPAEEPETVVTAELQTETPVQEEEVITPAEATEVIAEAEVVTEIEQPAVVTDVTDPAYVEEVAKDLSAKRFGGLSALIGDKKKMRVVAVLGSIVGLSVFGFIFGSQFLGDTKVSAPESTGSSAIDTVQTPPVETPPQPVATTTDSTATGEVVATTVTNSPATGITSTGVTATGAVHNTGSITSPVPVPNLTPVNQIRTPNVHKSR